MNGKQIKRFRKSVEGLDPVNYNRAIKLFKKIKSATWLRHNIPNKPTIVSKKRHSGESFVDFRARRKVCNERRRDKDNLG